MGKDTSTIKKVIDYKQTAAALRIASDGILAGECYAITSQEICERVACALQVVLGADCFNAFTDDDETVDDWGLE